MNENLPQAVENGPNTKKKCNGRPVAGLFNIKLVVFHNSTNRFLTRN